MIKSAISGFFNYLQYEKKLSKNSLAAYQVDLEQFTIYCPEAISSSVDCEKYISYIQNQVYKPATLKRKASSIQQFLDYLYHDSWITSKIELPITTPKIPKTLPKVMTKVQIDSIISGLLKVSKTPLRDQIVINLLYKCGLRVDECVHITIENINRNLTIKVIGKRSKERIIPISKETLKLIKSYIKKERTSLEKSPSPYLILNRRGTNLTRQGITFIINKNTLGPLTTPHIFRHSFATHLLERDASIREVQELLGHSSIITTQKYTQVSTKKRRSIYDIAHPRSRHARKLLDSTMICLMEEQRKNKVQYGK